MTHLFPSLPTTASLGDVFARFPRGRAELMGFTDMVLRADGALGIGERELIAAYVSALNACGFCLNAHVAFARAFGIEADRLAALIDDPDATTADDRMRPLLLYVRKLTETPARMTAADAEAVYAAGWSEDGLTTPDLPSPDHRFGPTLSGPEAGSG